MTHKQTIKLLLGGMPFFSGATRGVQIPIKEGLFLTALVSSLPSQKPAKVLEVGSWTGFSALIWAHALDRFVASGGEVLCVDAWAPYFSNPDKGLDGYREMNELAASGAAFELFQHNVSCGPARIPIRHMRGQSADVLPTLPAGAFDIVYVDGSHYYDGVKADLLAAGRLVADGGLLVGDDLELPIGAELSASEARRHLDRDYIAAPSGRFYHPGVSLAVDEVIGPVASFGRKWFVRRSGESFTVSGLENARIIIPAHWPDDMKAEARRLLKMARSADDLRA